MLANIDLPRGIRNHNPGNLRSACWAHSKTRLINGFAVFGSDEEGLVNLAQCCWDFYTHHHLNTVAAFVSRYAPASENDLLAYENFMARWCAIPEKEITSRDIDLRNINHAEVWMGGIIRIECGVPSHGLQRGPEWFNRRQLLTALRATGNYEVTP
jgi:hypothetical protein